jgi:hypothetical protein
MTALETLFGANWRTTLTGWGSAITSTLTLLAAMPYEIEELGTIIPPEWKAKVAAVGLIATFLLRLIHAGATKDAAVSGNGSADDPLRKASNTGRSQIVGIILLCGCALALTGCLTVSGSLSYPTQYGTARITSDGKRVVLEGEFKGTR